MKKLIIVGIFLLVGICFRNIYYTNQVLPINEKIPCVYQAFGDVGQQLGVVSYVGNGIWMSARHVVDPNYAEDLGVGKSSGQIIGLGINIQNIGNDIGLFELDDYMEFQDYARKSGHQFNEKTCDTGFNGLITYVSGSIQKIPVQLSGTFINYNPDYGQSGSPIFRGGKIIGIISRKYNGGAVVSLLP